MGNTVIDDIFGTPEPLYTRVGSGGLIKGVEQALPEMKLGDRWVLTIPGELAFGKKGRPPSAGKPRVPPDATVTFDVEIVGLPGKEGELIDLFAEQDAKREKEEADKKREMEEAEKKKDAEVVDVVSEVKSDEPKKEELIGVVSEAKVDEPKKEEGEIIGVFSEAKSNEPELLSAGGEAISLTTN